MVHPARGEFRRVTATPLRDSAFLAKITRPGFTQVLRRERLFRRLDASREPVIWVSAPPGTGSGDEPYLHVGEETGIVVRGSAECRVGEELFPLEAGDAITFASSIPHTWRNSGNDSLEMIWVSTPPTF